MQQPGQQPLLWCELCFRVTIVDGDLSLPIDPLALSPGLSVHIAALDADHERLIDILNHLHDATKAGESSPRLKTIADQLLDHLDGHFQREERLLEDWGFPGLEEHRDQHADVHDRMRHFVEDLLSGAKDLADIGQLMKFCLVAHLADDMKYKDYLAERRAHGH